MSNKQLIGLVIGGCVLAWGLLASGVVAADGPEPLLSNGDFAKVDAKGWATDWPKVDGVSFQQEGKDRFLRFTSPKAGETVMLYRQVELPKPAPAAVQVLLRWRARDIQVGEQPWYDGRVMLKFRNPGGQDVSPEPEQPSIRGTSDGWVERRIVARVPQDAAMLAVMPCLFQVKGGAMDLAFCQVYAASADQLPSTPVAAFVGPAVAAGTIISSPTLTPKDSAGLPPELHVVGNQLQTKEGKVVWLQGLCVDSLEWSEGGERIDKSIPVAIDQWKSNVIRLPVLDDYWFGRGKGQKDGGLAYRKIVDDAIQAAGSRGAYVAVDLHRFGAPVPEHAVFWMDVATRYRNHPAVLFELFNECHDISWKVWRDGGSIKDPSNKRENVAAENNQKVGGDVSVGMQALLNTVRAVGARNMVIVGGLDWSYDLSGIAKGYALEDAPEGDGIMYSAHIYPWKSDWAGKVLIAADKHPIFVGEVGCMPDWKGWDFIPKSMQTEKLGLGCPWPADMIGLIQKHKLNWTGFSFHPTCGPNVISDWEYTPTPYWGGFVKEALAGKQFQMTRMR